MMGVPPVRACVLFVALGVLFGCERSDSERSQTTAATPQSGEASPAASPQAGKPAAAEYTFSTDWVSDHLPVWQEVLAPYRDKPDIRYLEIGVFEGRSLIWMLENIFTDPSSRAVGVDVLRRAQLVDNLNLSGQASRVEIVTDLSQFAMRHMELESFDVIYVDGSHRADDAMADVVLAWGLLKPEGLIILDDYEWPGAYVTDPQQAWPENLTPGIAIDAFMSAYRDTIEFVHVGYQVVLRKKPHPCDSGHRWECSLLGPYQYYWIEKQLNDATLQPVELSPEERRLVERILRLQDPSGKSYRIPDSLKEDPLFAALCERLDLPLD